MELIPIGLAAYYILGVVGFLYYCAEDQDVTPLDIIMSVFIGWLLGIFFGVGSYLSLGKIVIFSQRQKKSKR